MTKKQFILNGQKVKIALILSDDDKQNIYKETLIIEEAIKHTSGDNESGNDENTNKIQVRKKERKIIEKNGIICDTLLINIIKSYWNVKYQS